jgi:hypothetical protein
MTPEEIEAEFWAHYYNESGAKEEFDDDDFDALSDDDLDDIKSLSVNKLIKRICVWKNYGF